MPGLRGCKVSLYAKTQHTKIISANVSLSMPPHAQCSGCPCMGSPGNKCKMNASSRAATHKTCLAAPQTWLGEASEWGVPSSSNSGVMGPSGPTTSGTLALVGCAPPCAWAWPAAQGDSASQRLCLIQYKLAQHFAASVPDAVALSQQGAAAHTWLAPRTSAALTARWCRQLQPHAAGISLPQPCACATPRL